MKKIAFFLFILLVVVLSIKAFKGTNPDFSSKAIREKISLPSFEGRWYINMSNFPMWLKGDKINPTFNYSLETKDGVAGLHADVQYYKKDKRKHVEGFDKPQNEFNTAFLWRGSGILKIVKSRWEIVAWEPSENWAIMHFEKTGFTPEGYDLFSRNKQLEATVMKSINKKLAELGIEGKLSAIRQD
jgi:lipocalin